MSELQEQSNPSADSAPKSFIERKKVELARERGIVDEAPPEAPQQVDLDMGMSDAQQTELTDEALEEQASTFTEPGLELQNDPLEEETNSDDSDVTDDSAELEEADVDWRARSKDFEEKASTATAMAESMQGDYTRKTQLLADSRRRLEQDIAVNEGVLKTYVDNAGIYAQKYDNVNWSHLQSTLDPATYQQRVGEYRQAVSLRDRAISQHQTFVTTAKTTMSRLKEEEAGVSRDILKATIPNWNDGLYASLGKFASEKLGFAPEYFKEITDHKLIGLIYRDFAARDPQSAIKNVQLKAQRSNQTRNAPRQNDRSALTRLEKKRRENPGNRELTRQAFELRLRRERQDRQN